MVGPAFRKRGTRQFLAHPVLQRQSLRLGIPDINFARIRVAVRADDPQALVRCSRAKAHFLAWKLGLQPAELRLECMVLEVPPNAVILVFREENAIVCDGEDDTPEVDMLRS